MALTKMHQKRSFEIVPFCSTQYNFSVLNTKSQQSQLVRVLKELRIVAEQQRVHIKNIEIEKQSINRFISFKLTLYSYFLCLIAYRTTKQLADGMQAV